MEKMCGRVKQTMRRRSTRIGIILAAAVTCFGACMDAGAFEIPTDSEDLTIRWDNTLRYTYGLRVKGQNKELIGDANIDDGNRNFARATVTNRLDILSEFDAAYKKDFGIRLSGAGWYDQRAAGGVDNTSSFTSNHLVNGQPSTGLSKETKELYAGPNGELLDAFAYGKFTLGEVPVNVKIGRHAILWGEALLGSGGVQGINYGQSPIDVGKALTIPGIEIKELIRPLNQISLQTQPTKDLTLAAQYYLEWEATRMPGAGSYLSFADLLGPGSETLITGFNPMTHSLDRIRNAGDIRPRDVRDWGLSARWSPAWLEGTMGVYYRNFSDKAGQMHISPLTGSYNFAYASGIDLFGISLSQQKFGVSIGTEVNYRRNMPLSSEAALIAPAFAHIPGTVSANLPGTGETYGTRGETVHAVVNFLKLFSDTPVFNTASLLTEFVWDRWLSTSQGGSLFKGRDGYVGADRVTKDHIAGTVVFTPTWYQVVSGVDLSMPMSASIGLVGTSAMTSETNNKNSGQYGIGVSADIFQRYKADLTYVGFFGTFDTNPFTGQVTANSPLATLKDRNMITLTLKTSF
jgi:hypothetical protein